MNNHMEEDTLIDSYVIYTKTDLEGIITHASTAFCNICGYSKDELIGKSHNIVRHPDMEASDFEDLWKTIKDGHKWEGIIKNLKKDGDFYITKTIISPIFDKNHTLLSYDSVREDITVRVQAEEFQRKLGLLLKESKLKNANLKNEYKNSSIKQDKLIKELNQKIQSLQKELNVNKSAKEFALSKLHMKSTMAKSKKIEKKSQH
ncbi:MAG: PAS domain S-box protein [Arcobacteraceae bacterium]|nr:PAS domain S-box protein [Arcobacteraceae bacterium]